ncbi:hypothetical protein EKO27_g4340 [Xylaria grammica]|uniref:Uncharacterized protein n=1 Tax=Xylaria grammica TaxID=363999 RepID=A0A439D8Q0_9PEZI|nr:hypothetical protein EKO27_g4340 [Xylaria grammica]
MALESNKSPQDPRLGKPCSYDRDQIVSDLCAFYHFLPHIETRIVHSAPPDGWPQITSATLALHGIHKTAEAVDLLRHLPYLDGPRPWIAISAFACDYRIVGEQIDARTKPGWLYDAAEEQWPPWVVQLTTGRDREGHCYVLDTTDGTIARHCASGIHSQYPPSYAPDDVRSWRDKLCDPELWTLCDLLDEWRGKYRRMEFLGVPQPLSDSSNAPSLPDIYYRLPQDSPGDWCWEETEALREIYRQHGWPDEYNRDACILALREWWQGQ